MNHLKMHQTQQSELLLFVHTLACARIGAVHSVVFGAFSSDSLKERINDSKCKILITQDTGVRGTKQNIPMKLNADSAVLDTPSIEHVIVVSRTSTRNYNYVLNRWRVKNSAISI